MDNLKELIESAFEQRAEITPATVGADVRDAVGQALALIDSGQMRVAEPTDNGWQVNDWLPGGTSCNRTPRLLHRSQRGLNALLRQHWRLCR